MLTRHHQQPETTKKTPKRRYGRTRSAPAPAGSKITKASSPFNQKSIINNLHPSFIRVAFFLAVYLFVGTLCFSVAHHHIKGKKSNAVLDAIYLSIVTMTTVGYGDLVPENVATKLIVCVYVFLGMALVGLMLTKAADYLVEKQENLLVNAISRNHKTGTVLDVTHESEMKRLKEMGKIESRDIELCIQEFERLDVDQTGTLSASDITLVRPLPPNRK
ncbi:hypothetical protein QQ045_024756 [Rhodiola kirilowii]